MNNNKEAIHLTADGLIDTRNIKNNKILFI